MSAWHLDDADELAAAYKYTFYKPSVQVLQKVRPGECVKLIFRFEGDDADAPAVERMWVLVDELLPDGRFKGRLNNEPLHIKVLKLDDPVEFSACHVIATEHDDDNVVERYVKRCFVTQRVLSEGARVGCLYREEPDFDDDSGWRFTANDETAAYMDDARNLAYVSLGEVLNEDDSFIQLLDAPAGSAFVWDSMSDRFVPCKDEG